MKYLLDTHVLIWALQDSHKLPQEIKDIIVDENNDIYVSVISLWEIGIKHKKNPSVLPYSAKEIINFSQRARYIFLALGVNPTSEFEKLECEHKDPFDKMLVAQSISSEIKIITHDYKIKEIGDNNCLYF